MKVKFELDLDADELSQTIKSDLNKATALTMGAATQEARRLAGSRLEKGLDHWNRGFKSHRISDDLYVITMEGKLASWMEDGIKAGEVSQSIMSGNRARKNQAEKKNYVDVPFFKDADQAGNVKGTNLNIRAFADADSMMRSVKFSDHKKKTVREEKRVISRIEDVIKSVDPSKKANTQYLTIRRVTDGSQWPKTPFEGAKVFEDIDSFIDRKFDEFLDKVM